MRPRTLVVLFVVVAALAAFIWFYERDLPSSDERAELARRVLRLEGDEVTALTLVHGGERVRLERLPPPAAQADDSDEPSPPAAWRLREPLDAPADRAAVERLVETLAGLEKERTLEEPDLAGLGLAEPRGRLLIESGEAEQVELLVGSEVPASATMIVTLAGRPEAYVVSTGLWREIVRPGGDWRSRELGVTSREEIERVALDSGERRLILGRRGDEFWVESPYVDRADAALVSTLLAELTALRAESFVDAPAEPPALDAGAVEVVLDGATEPLRIELGEALGEKGDLRRVRVDGQLFESRTDLGEALARPAAEWRSRAWTGLEAFEIDRLMVREGEGETLFTRDAGDWLRDGEPAAYSAVSELLYALTGAEAARLDETELAGRPRLAFELAGSDGEQSESLTLYAPGVDGASPARTSGREITLVLDEGTVADLLLKLEEARTAAPPAASDELLDEIGED